MSFEVALKETLKHEGGWAKHPLDPGGSTMKGITKATYENWMQRAVNDNELKAIPDAAVEAIYRTQYWDRVRADELPPGIGMMVFDFAVNSGPARAIRHLQSVIGVEPDGQIGPQTMAAVSAYVAKHGVPNLIRSYSFSRLTYLRSLKTWRVFGRGWERRVVDIERVASRYS